MFYYLTDKENPSRIRDASESKKELIALLEWIPEYTEKDILTTEKELVPTSDGWTEKEFYDELKETLDSDVEMQRTKVEELEEENRRLSEQIGIISEQVEILIKRDEPIAVDYTPFSDDEIRTTYLETITDIIKKACSDIIYDYYPAHKQLNISMLADGDEEKIKFIAYRDNLTKQCNSFIAELEAATPTREEMVSQLELLDTGRDKHHHGQGTLLELGFKEFKYVYEPKEVLV